jgi:hypothetical protein
MIGATGLAVAGEFDTNKSSFVWFLLWLQLQTTVVEVAPGSFWFWFLLQYSTF